jgi:hypothetical protein
MVDWMTRLRVHWGIGSHFLVCNLFRHKFIDQKVTACPNGYVERFSWKKESLEISLLIFALSF